MVVSLLYSTYLGGFSKEYGQWHFSGYSGNVGVTGQHIVRKLPVINALQPSYGGGGFWRAFAAKLNSSVLRSFLVHICG